MTQKNSLQKLTLQGVSLLLYLNALNLFVVFLALYFSAFFVFSHSENIHDNFRDIQLHIIIISSLISIAAGYIINHFYDEDKDKLNQPIKSFFLKFISHKTYLYLYIVLNFLSLVLASFVSYKLVIYLVLYQFILWFYSHKLAKLFYTKNIAKVLVILLPFFALVLHFNKLNFKIILFGTLLSLILLVKDLMKDMKHFTTDSLLNYETIPNVFGMKKSKVVLLVLLVLCLLVSFVLSNYKEVGDMIWYFRASNIVFLASAIGIFYPNTKIFVVLEWFLKLWIFLGILSIVLIDWKALPLHRISF